jgi:hypothetical protein
MPAPEREERAQSASPFPPATQAARPPVTEPGMVAAATRQSLSMSDLLASCVSARAVSTPPGAECEDAALAAEAAAGERSAA